jgi:hypothetical protein
MPRWLHRAIQRFDDGCCSLGWHRWDAFVTYTGSGSRTCRNCDRRQFFFGGQWRDVPRDEQADGFGGKG